MSLNGALQVGRTALVASQAALQVAGDNMANAATEGYHRRSIQLSPVRGEIVGRGHIVGQGVQIEAIRREVDVALQARYRDALGEQQAAAAAHDFLAAVETIQAELTDNDLSTLLSEFFNAFSEAANNPSDNAVRAVTVQQGVSLANRIGDMRRDYDVLLESVDRKIEVTVETVNDLLDQIELINNQITQSENGVGQANALRDQRDLLVDKLSKHLDITVIDQGDRSIDILVNSIPILLAGRSRGVEFRKATVNGELEVTVRVAEDGSKLDVQSGTIGALLAQRDGSTTPSITQTLDDFTAELIFQVNRLHAEGQGRKGYEDVTGTYRVNDSTVNLNSAGANLPFRIENGSFFINMTHQGTGLRTSHRIDVDGDAMSMDDLINEINVAVGVPNLTASLTVEGALRLTADPGFEMSFSEDSAGALAALGVNTFFTGETAKTIGVNQELLDDPSRLALGLGHVDGSNGNAIKIANLQDTPMPNLGATSLRTYWQNSVNQLAVRTSAAEADAESTSLVRDNLNSQIQAVSGVSLDEEAINLLTAQRQFQAAARFITVIDETLQILISLA